MDLDNKVETPIDPNKNQTEQMAQYDEQKEVCLDDVEESDIVTEKDPPEGLIKELFGPKISLAIVA